MEADGPVELQDQVVDVVGEGAAVVADVLQPQTLVVADVVGEEARAAVRSSSAPWRAAKVSRVALNSQVRFSRYRNQVK